MGGGMVHATPARNEDEYHDLVIKLGEKLSGEDQDAHTRLIARQEAEKVVMTWLAIGAAGGLLIWLPGKLEVPGWVVTVGLVAAWVVWIIWRNETDPNHDLHLVVHQAEDLNRIHVMREAQASGQRFWIVHEKEYDTDKRRIVPDDNDEQWDGSWQRVYHFALELKGMSPRRRRKRLAKAAADVSPLLKQGAEMAKANDAELIFWARGLCG